MAFLTPGEKLKYLRKQLNVTQEQLKAANISRSFISLVECNKRRLTKETAERLIEVLMKAADDNKVSIDVDLNYLTMSEVDAAIYYCNNIIKTYDKLLNIDDLNEVIEISKKYRLNDIAYEAFLIKANILYNKNEYLSAFQCYESALEFSILLNNANSMSMLYNKLGKCKVKLISYEEALAYFNKAYDAAREHDNRICKKNSLFNRALVYKFLGDIQLALSSLEEFFRIITKEECLEDYLNGMMLKGNCYVAINEYKNALDIFLLLNEIIDKSKQHTLAGYIYNNTAVSYSKLGFIQQALDYFDKAEEIRRNGEELNLAYTYIDKATMLLEQSLTCEATNLLEKAMFIGEKFNDIKCVLDAVTLLEKIYVDLDDNEKLEEVYIHCLYILENNNAKNKILELLPKLILLSINSLNLELSKKYVNQMINLQKCN